MDYRAEHDAHSHSAESERERREEALDQTIADSFPASDPPSTVPNPDNHELIAD